MARTSSAWYHRDRRFQESGNGSIGLTGPISGCDNDPLDSERYNVPGHIYHLTHRGHDRVFLLQFAKDRTVAPH